MSSALKKLSNERPSSDDITTALKLLETESPRSSAVVGSTLLEDVAQFTIKDRMVSLSKDEADRLFVGSAPLASFSSKIQLLYALGIIGPKIRHDLDSIREIRNAFAHAKISITFETPAIANCISGLHCLGLVVAPAGPQARFATSIRILMMHLIAKWSGEKNKTIPEEIANYDPPPPISADEPTASEQTPA